MQLEQSDELVEQIFIFIDDLFIDDLCMILETSISSDISNAYVKSIVTSTNVQTKLKNPIKYFVVLIKVAIHEVFSSISEVNTVSTVNFTLAKFA